MARLYPTLLFALLVLVVPVESAGTVIQLYLMAENAANEIVDSPPLAGTDALSTTVISTTLPLGFSRAVARAVWRP